MVGRNRVGQVWSKGQAMQALELFRQHGGLEQPEFVEAVRAADWLEGPMPSPIVTSTWDEVDRYGESNDGGTSSEFGHVLDRFLRFGGDQRP